MDYVLLAVTRADTGIEVVSKGRDIYSGLLFTLPASALLLDTIACDAGPPCSHVIWTRATPSSTSGGHWHRTFGRRWSRGRSPGRQARGGGAAAGRGARPALRRTPQREDGDPRHEPGAGESGCTPTVTREGAWVDLPPQVGGASSYVRQLPVPPGLRTYVATTSEDSTLRILVGAARLTVCRR